VEEFGRQVRRSPELAAALERMWRVSRPMSCSTTCSGTGLLNAAARAWSRARRSRSSTGSGAPRSTTSSGPPRCGTRRRVRTLLGPRRPAPPEPARPSAPRARQGGDRLLASGLDTSPMPSARSPPTRRPGARLRPHRRRRGPDSLHAAAHAGAPLAVGFDDRVGDIARPRPWAPSSWDDVTAHLSPRRRARKVS